MRYLTDFFRRLLSGKLSDPAEFKEALAVERRRQEGDNTLTERFFGTLETDAAFKAPERLKVGATVFTGDMYLRQQHRADWQNTKPAIQLFAARMIEAARRKGIPLYVHMAIRTKEEQDRLKAAGRSKASWPRAPHVQGAAVDIVHSIYHWELTPDEWRLLGKIGKQIAHQLGIAVEWGGDWRFYDPAHWELVGWKDDIRTDLKTGAPVRKTARKLYEETKGFK